MAINIATLPSKEIMPGYHGKMIHTATMSLVYWDVEEGAEVPEHSHKNEQIMQVLEGRFEFWVAGEKAIYEAGDLVVIKAHQKHGGKTLTPCKLMDVFSPTREEYH